MPTPQETEQQITTESSELWTNLSPDLEQEVENTQNEAERDIKTTEVVIQTQQKIDWAKSEISQEINKQDFIQNMKESWTPFESQSPEIQALTEEILWPKSELELTAKQKKYNEIKSELVDGLKGNPPNIKKIISSVRKLLRNFLSWFTRRKNIGENINYTPNAQDKDYLINTISATLDPEKRSQLTYLLGKIKDEENKEKLKEKWIENPSQFQLFLQNCKPWQMILTNAESTWPKLHEKFSQATQIVSWARWCHAAVISDIKEENWIITDATIVQATWKWIEEISLKTSFNEIYKNGDLLLWTFQPPEKWEDVVNSCKNYIWWKYSQINLVADTIFDRVNPFHLHKQEKNKYCSELVFTWMQEAWLKLPDPHTTPADLLSTSAVTPEYCCYCEKFS